MAKSTVYSKLWGQEGAMADVGTRRQEALRRLFRVGRDSPSLDLLAASVLIG